MQLCYRAFWIRDLPGGTAQVVTREKLRVQRSQVTTSSVDGNCAASPYCVTLRKAIKAGSGNGKNGGRSHQCFPANRWACTSAVSHRLGCANKATPTRSNHLPLITPQLFASKPLPFAFTSPPVPHKTFANWLWVTLSVFLVLPVENVHAFWPEYHPKYFSK